MIKLPYDEEMRQSATAWSKQLGSLKDSITSGRGNIAGRIGELALAKYLGVDTPEDKYDHDIKFNKEIIEVKTKRRIAAPKPFYDVSVAETSRHQTPDRYAFVSLEFEESGYYGQPADGLNRRGGKQYKNLLNVWYCGDITYKKFWDTAELWKKGRRDESNDFTTLVNMWNLPISKLDNNLINDPFNF